MSDGGSPKSFAARFWSLCLYLFGGVILLMLTIELAKQIWWVFVVLGLVISAVAALRWWWKRRSGWD